MLQRGYIVHAIEQYVSCDSYTQINSHAIVEQVCKTSTYMYSASQLVSFKSS